THASASYESPYGTIISNWEVKGLTFKWLIQIPANCNADIYIPKLHKNQRIMVNGKDHGFILTENPYFQDFFLYKSVGNGKFEINIDYKI
ncbi:MAG TPA: alpha-L-rhamnosidase C-terminal domain-containing protein, partial [Prolixibacteraceae bacterium]|nr:alpha-L-rhamnosidase C-terminal domain-containing protein [Prolixibacteraceae bacterium]